MSVGQSNIIQGAVLTATMDPFHTVPALTRERISNATVTNDTGGNVQFSAEIITGSNTSMKIYNRSLVDGETYTCPELIGQILEPGAIVKAKGLGLSFDVSAFTQV